MEAEYIKGAHYFLKEKVCAYEAEVTHWESKDGGLTSLFTFGVARLAEKGCVEMRCYPTADELRRLSSMFATAADDLEAHAAFIKARDEAKAGESA